MHFRFSSSSQIIILFFHLSFQETSFPPPPQSATIFSIVLLPLGFLLSFSSLCLSLTLPQALHSCFCLSKLCFFLLHEGRSGKVGWIFLLCAHKTAPINTLQSCRGELAWLFQHFQNLQLQLMKVWLMLENHKLILKLILKCYSFPPITSSGLPQQALSFTLETLSHALKHLEPCSNFFLPKPQDTE